jgi:hypothetical protein
MLAAGSKMPVLCKSKCGQGRLALAPPLQIAVAQREAIPLELSARRA